MAGPTLQALLDEFAAGTAPAPLPTREAAMAEFAAAPAAPPPPAAPRFDAVEALGRLQEFGRQAADAEARAAESAKRERDALERLKVSDLGRSIFAARAAVTGLHTDEPEPPKFDNRAAALMTDREWNAYKQELIQRGGR